MAEWRKLDDTNIDDLHAYFAALRQLYQEWAWLGKSIPGETGRSYSPAETEQVINLIRKMHEVTGKIDQWYKRNYK